jgi:flavin-dependent dehydrogenase
LPLGSKKRVISGNNFLLTGDAASLIDPFTGEGIGNAMYSGMLAAAHIQNCISVISTLKQVHKNKSFCFKVIKLKRPCLRVSLVRNQTTKIKGWTIHYNFKCVI